MKFLLVLGVMVVLLTLVIGTVRSRGAASKAADESYVLLANTARYFLYVVIAIVVALAIVLLIQA